MAQIDLKYATIRIKDGYSAIGAVSNVSGYPIGTATMTVSGFTGALATGDLFTLPGDTTEYQITAHTETLGNTTSITFTPPLVMMAAQNAAITILPHQLEVKVGDGNMTYNEKRNVIYTKNRGRLYTVRLGDEDPVEARLDFIWEFLKASTGNPPTVEDALKQRGNASNWVSSAADPCEPYAVDIEIEYDPPCVGVQREIITLADFRYEDLGHEIKNGMVTISGKCNVTDASIVRAA